MGKIKTRIERNKEIITEVYRWIEEEEEERLNYLNICGTIWLALRNSWSYVDLATLISLIKREMTKEELNKIPVDTSYGSWCLDKVVSFLAELIMDYPHIIEKLYVKKTQNDKSA